MHSFARRFVVLTLLSALAFPILTPNVLPEVLWDSDGTGMHWVHIDNFETREQAFSQCAVFAITYGPPGASGGCFLMGVIDSPALMAWAGRYQRGFTGVFDVANYYFNKCESKSVYNISTGDCGFDEQKGTPPLESCVGNPINIAVGNKFQKETDYLPKIMGAPSFFRFYNSLDGLWRHSYSSLIRFAIGKLSLVHEDGCESFFNLEGDIATAYPGETGTLIKTDTTWLYTSGDKGRLTFDVDGRLLQTVYPTGHKQTLSYSNGQVTVTGEPGQTLSFTEDAQHQPMILSASEVQIANNYDINHHLVHLIRTRGIQTEQRLFHYEDACNADLLTGITDERGVRFATWAYDDQARAISSQHSGAADLTLVTYNADGSTTVTNELGKTTLYRFQQVGGVKRVTSIEGESSPNCLSSNSSYTYDDRGQMLTKTDAKGLVTTYTYNDRALETSRTEAAGTPLARTTITEWGTTQALPVRIVEPDRTTVYSYEAQGRVEPEKLLAITLAI